MYWFIHAWHYWEDDAWIHLEFARSLSRGQGFAFNGRVVAGDTAPLWVLLLAGMHALIPDWIVAAKFLTVLGAVVGISGIYAFARQLQRSLPALRDIPLFPALMVLMLVTNPFTCYWIFSGMEAVAAAGLACWIVLFATRAQTSTGRFLAGCLLAGIAPLVRPEMTFLTAIIAFPLLGQWRALPRSAPKALSFVAGLILLCAPLAIWSLYSLHAFGHLLPNTNAAKRALPGQSVPLHLATVYAIGFPLILAAAIAGVIFLLFRASSAVRSLRSAVESVFRPRSERTEIVLAAWIFIAWVLITTAFYILNHTYVQTRYILVSAPGLSIVILALAFSASRAAGRIATTATVVVAIAVSLAIVRPFVWNKGVDCDAVRGLAMYIRTNVPPDAPVAVYSIGEIAFVSEHRVLWNPEILVAHQPVPAGILLMTVELVVGHNVHTRCFCRHEEHRRAPMNRNVRICDRHERFAAWTWHLSQYEEQLPIEMWKFATANQARRETQQH